MLLLTVMVSWVGREKMHVGSLFEVHLLPCKYLLLDVTHKMLSFKGSLLTWRVQLLCHCGQPLLERVSVPLRDKPRYKT